MQRRGAGGLGPRVCITDAVGFSLMEMQQCSQTRCVFRHVLLPQFRAQLLDLNPDVLVDSTDCRYFSRAATFSPSLFQSWNNKPLSQPCISGAGPDSPNPGVAPEVISLGSWPLAAASHEHWEPGKENFSPDLHHQRSSPPPSRSQALRILLCCFFKTF